MADYTWPFSDTDPLYRVEAFDEALEFNVELSVGRSGKISTLSLPGARWRATMQFPDSSVGYLQQRRQIEAFLASLRGGADRLLLHNLLTPQPLGTMRGTVTLAAAVAAGATSAQITGGRAEPNLLVSSGFEIDTNVDGLADGWQVYSNGAVTGGTPDGLVAGNGSPYAQRMYAALLGAGGADQYGIRKIVDVSVGVGLAYTFAADVKGSANGVASSRLLVDWFGSGGSYLSSSSQLWSMTSAWARRSLTATAPAGALTARLYVWMETGTTSSPLSITIDNAQFEQASAATPYAGLPTLLRGDRLTIGNQRVMLTADATANDAGAVTVQFQPAHRAGATSGSAVTLVRPATKYVLAQPVVQMPARGSTLPGFAVELVEDAQ